MSQESLSSKEPTTMPTLLRRDWARITNRQLPWLHITRIRESGRESTPAKIQITCGRVSWVSSVIPKPPLVGAASWASSACGKRGHVLAGVDDSIVLLRYQTTGWDGVTKK